MSIARRILTVFLGVPVWPRGRKKNSHPFQMEENHLAENPHFCPTRAHLHSTSQSISHNKEKRMEGGTFKIGGNAGGTHTYCHSAGTNKKIKSKTGR